MAQGDTYQNTDRTSVSANSTVTVDVRPASGVQVTIKSEALAAPDGTTSNHAIIYPYDFSTSTQGPEITSAKGNGALSNENHTIMLNNSLGLRIEYKNDTCSSKTSSSNVSGVQHK